MFMIASVAIGSVLGSLIAVPSISYGLTRTSGVESAKINNGLTIKYMPSNPDRRPR